MKKINVRLNHFLKDVLKLIRKPVMSVLPGQLSFFLLLSIIPVILIIGIILSFIPVSPNSLVYFINTSLPANTGNLILPLLFEKGYDYNIIILIVSALLLVSKGTRSIIVVASNIYSIKYKLNIKVVIKSFVLAIQLILVITFLIIFPVMGTRILHILDNFKVISNLTDDFIRIFNVLKWPITIFIIFINLKIIYRYSPNQNIPKESVTRGSLFTAVLWSLSTWIYSFYITHLAKYNVFYGRASNIIVLMLWIYLISYIFVLGMSINASYLKNQNDLQ